MTQQQAIALWRQEDLPDLQARLEADGRPDYPARAESWGVFIDGLCRDGIITPAQYAAWDSPPECVRRASRDRKWNPLT
jgi:predicted flap endonuclease-1-like 5' DNA nuclease